MVNGRVDGSRLGGGAVLVVGLMTQPRWKSDLPFYSVQEALANPGRSNLRGRDGCLVANVDAEFVGTGVRG